MAARSRRPPRWYSPALAVPAVHGPEDGERDADGNVNCEVTGFVLSGQGLPTVYVSGDNASIRTVAEISRRVPPIDAAVLHAGAARVPAKFDGRPLSPERERVNRARPSGTSARLETLVFTLSLMLTRPADVSLPALQEDLAAAALPHVAALATGATLALTMARGAGQDRHAGAGTPRVQENQESASPETEEP